jgi:hypothetical protein
MLVVLSKVTFSTSKEPKKTRLQALFERAKVSKKS